MATAQATATLKPIDELTDQHSNHRFVVEVHEPSFVFCQHVRPDGTATRFVRALYVVREDLAAGRLERRTPSAPTSTSALRTQPSGRPAGAQAEATIAMWNEFTDGSGTDLLVVDFRDWGAVCG